MVQVAGEQPEFRDEGAVGDEPAQIREVAAPGARQQVGVDRVGLGAGGLAPLVDGLGVHRVDRQPGLQEALSS